MTLSNAKYTSITVTKVEEERFPLTCGSPKIGVNRCRSASGNWISTRPSHHVWVLENVMLYKLCDWFSSQTHLVSQSLKAEASSSP